MSFRRGDKRGTKLRRRLTEVSDDKGFDSFGGNGRERGEANTTQKNSLSLSLKEYCFTCAWRKKAMGRGDCPFNQIPIVLSFGVQIFSGVPSENRGSIFKCSAKCDLLRDVISK